MEIEERETGGREIIYRWVRGGGGEQREISDNGVRGGGGGGERESSDNGVRGGGGGGERGKVVTMG